MSETQPETHRGLTVEEVGRFHDRGFLVAGKLLDDDHVETTACGVRPRIRHSARKRPVPQPLHR